MRKWASKQPQLQVSGIGQSDRWSLFLCVTFSFWISYCVRSKRRKQTIQRSVWSAGKFIHKCWSQPSPRGQRGSQRKRGRKGGMTDKERNPMEDLTCFVWTICICRSEWVSESMHGKIIGQTCKNGQNINEPAWGKHVTWDYYSQSAKEASAKL